MTSNFELRKAVEDRLVFGNPSMNISYDKDDNERAIVIRGNCDAFLTLSNLILLFSNSQDERFSLTDLKFVESEIEFILCINDDLDSVTGEIAIVSEKSINWWISEDAAAIVAKDIHALGFELERLTYSMDTPDREMTLVFSQSE